MAGGEGNILEVAEQVYGHRLLVPAPCAKGASLLHCSEESLEG